MPQAESSANIPLRVVLVDDEPLARERLRRLLLAAGRSVTIVGEAATGEEAIALIGELRPDAVFLDVQMPILDGFDVVELLPRPRPQIIFVTAYDRYAIRAFDVHAVDYLTKPVHAGRLERSLERIRALQRGDHQTLDESDGVESMLAGRPDRPISRIVVRSGSRIRVVPVEEIARFEAEQKVVMAHTADGSHPVDMSLDELERRLEPGRFVRTHRSHLVNSSRIAEVFGWFAGSYMIRLRDGTEIPLARRRARDVRRLLET